MINTRSRSRAIRDFLQKLAKTSSSRPAILRHLIGSFDDWLAA